MGFLENLRKAQEAKKEAEKNKADILAAQKEEAYRERRADQGYHYERYKKAREHCMNSAFPQMLDQLKSIDPKILITDNFFAAMRGEAKNLIEWQAGLFVQNWPILSEDSAWMRVLLEDIHIGAGMIKGFYRAKHYKELFVIEFDPEGDLSLHGKSTLRVPFYDWQGNQASQEDVLGRIYKNPKKIICWQSIPATPNYR